MTSEYNQRKLAEFSFFSISFYTFILAFFPLYCQYIGFDARQISHASSLTTIATILAAPAALEITHRLCSARTFAIILSAALPLVYLGLVFLPSEIWLVLSTFFLFNFVKRSLDTIVETETIRRSAFGELSFERVRVWGSIGFVVVSLYLGIAADLLGIEHILLAALPLLLIQVISTWRVRPLLAETPARKRHSADAPLDGSARQLALALTLAATFINWASHGPLYVYLSVYLDALGWSKFYISLAWILGVVSEILFFFVFAKLERHFGVRAIFRWGLAATTIRWMLFGVSNHPGVILFAQLLHSLSFAAVYLASIRLVYAYSSPQMKERGQGWLISFGQGAGALCGRIGAGVVTAALPSYLELPTVFVGAAVLSASSVFMGWFLPDPEQPVAASETH